MGRRFGKMLNDFMLPLALAAARSKVVVLSLVVDSLFIVDPIVC